MHKATLLLYCKVSACRQLSSTYIQDRRDIIRRNWHAICRYCLHYVSLMQDYAAGSTHAERILEQRTPGRNIVPGMYCRSVMVMVGRCVLIPVNSVLSKPKKVYTQYIIHTLLWLLLLSFTANAQHLAWRVINRCANKWQSENTVRNWPIKASHIHLKLSLSILVLRTRSPADFHFNSLIWDCFTPGSRGECKFNISMHIWTFPNKEQSHF